MSDITVVIQEGESYTASIAEITSASSISFDPSGTDITDTNMADALKALEHRSFTGTTAPTGSTVGEGDVWYDTDDNQMFVRQDSAWKEVVVGSESGTIDGGQF